nr:hypothetical protein [uncultured Capnocytophaga sp.]
MKGYIMEHKYDLFKGKGTNDFSNITYSVLEKDWYKKEDCFLGFEESLENIILIKKEFEKNKIGVFVVPIEYKKAKITIEEVREVAEREYLKVKSNNPDRYGELRHYHSHPMWFFFFADDYVLQEEGYAPGFWGVYIDKLTAKIMDPEVVRFYQFL